MVSDQFEQEDASLPVMDPEPEQKPVRVAQLGPVVSRGFELFDVGSPEVPGAEMVYDPIKRLPQFAGFHVGVLKDIHWGEAAMIAQYSRRPVNAPEYLCYNSASNATTNSFVPRSINRSRR